MLFRYGQPPVTRSQGPSHYAQSLCYRRTASDGKRRLLKHGFQTSRASAASSDVYIHTSRSRVRDLGELVTISTLCPHAFAFPPPRIQEFREFIGHVPNLLGLFQVLFAFLGNDQRPRLARWHHLHARSGAQDQVRPRAARKSRGQPQVGNVKRKTPPREKVA